MKSLSLAALLAAATLALPAAAQTQSTPRIDQRQANQERRIEQNKALADGKVTAKERARLEKTQDKQSRRIRREKHDGQKAH